MFSSNMTYMLAYDDNILASIEQVVSDIDVSDGGEQAQKNETQSLCNQLQISIACEIRCRLDRIYSEALRSLPVGELADSLENADIEASLKAELGTLHTEIDAVAQMAVNQEFTAPLTKLIKEKKTAREKHIRSTLNDVSAPDFPIELLITLC